MEFLRDLKRRDLMMKELAQGRELAKQLQKLLEPSAPVEQRQFLVNQILSIYTNAFNLLVNFQAVPPAEDSSWLSSHGGTNNTTTSAHNEHQLPPLKKRKIIPRRLEMVKQSRGESLPTDGYSWRKYGQKVILGAKYRRGYFRCTHRHSQGCTALKQVQKSDEDPTVFHVIYVGEHTCTQHRHVIRPSGTAQPPRAHLTPAQQDPYPQEAAAPNLQQHVTVQNEETDKGDQHKFYFRSVSFSTVFPPSPATSGSDHLPESYLREGYSGENSPIGHEFTLEELGIGPNFPFDCLGMLV